MRSFDAPDGQRWQAALLEASYGQVLLIFSADRSGELRQHPMPAEHLAEATGELAALDDAALATLLAQAAPWQPGA